MSEYLELGSVPVDEDCVQVGSREYESQWKAEGNRYVALLKQKFPQHEQTGVRFVVMAFPHDFGTYHEVVAKYQKDSKGEDFAYFVEAHLPTTWEDNQAILTVLHDGKPNEY